MSGYITCKSKPCIKYLKWMVDHPDDIDKEGDANYEPSICRLCRDYYPPRLGEHLASITYHSRFKHPKTDIVHFVLSHIKDMELAAELGQTEILIKSEGIHFTNEDCMKAKHQLIQYGLTIHYVTEAIKVSWGD